APRSGRRSSWPPAGRSAAPCRRWCPPRGHLRRPPRTGPPAGRAGRRRPRPERPAPPPLRQPPRRRTAVSGWFSSKHLHFLDPKQPLEHTGPGAAGVVLVGGDRLVVMQAAQDGACAVELSVLLAHRPHVQGVV